MGARGRRVSSHPCGFYRTPQQALRLRPRKVSRVSRRISPYDAWQRLLVSVLNVPLIVVLGHDNCGAVTAAKEAVETGEVPSGHIRDLVERITPSVLSSLREDKTDVNDMVVEHAKQTVRRLLDSSRVIFDAVDDYSTAVIAVAYRLEEGRAQLVSTSGVL